MQCHYRPGCRFVIAAQEEMCVRGRAVDTHPPIKWTQAHGVLFILACAFLCGLTVFLFRDQIKSRR